MLVLALFAFVSGAATSITPCVLPVLPALLSASASGGRRRVVGVISGLFVTFTIAIVGLASVVGSAGVADEGLRTFAILVLAVFGVALLLPRLAARIEAPLTRLARFGPKSRGDGFWSGVVVGGALGFVFAPCASPILAAVISVGATQGVSLQLVVVAIAFSLGAVLVLLLMAFGGRRIAASIRSAGRGAGLQRAMGVIMILTAVAMATDADLRFQSALADHLPSWAVTPTEGLENSGRVKAELDGLRGESRFTSAKREGSRLPVLGNAPEFTGNQRWFNTANGKPLTMKELRGKVVLIDFWTYTCINCVRTQPYLKAWEERYRDKGLVIVGVHTPEFSFEREARNVEGAIDREDLRYPVAQDNDFKTWDAWGNQYWPAKYLVDARGRVRYTHFGEGEYDTTEGAIRELLAEAGEDRLGAATDARGQVPSDSATPETYLGTDRAERFLPGPPTPGTNTYDGTVGDLPESHFALRGEWAATPESSIAGKGARLFANITAKRVFLVMSSAGEKPRKVQVLIDGKLHRTVTVREQKLYTLASFAEPGAHDLELRVAPGVAGYAFTFG